MIRPSQFLPFNYRNKAKAPAPVIGREGECLAYITERLRATGVTPSYKEIGDAMGVASKSGVHRLVSRLEARGDIRRMHHRARAIEVVGAPYVPVGRPLVDMTNRSQFLHWRWNDEDKTLEPLAPAEEWK